MADTNVNTASHREEAAQQRRHDLRNIVKMTCKLLTDIDPRSQSKHIEKTKA